MTLKPVQTVIDRLEEALEKAKAGELRSVAIVGLASDQTIWTHYATDDIAKLLGEMEILKSHITYDAMSDDG
jgi:hypothetical protein